MHEYHNQGYLIIKHFRPKKSSILTIPKKKLAEQIEAEHYFSRLNSDCIQ